MVVPRAWRAAETGPSCLMGTELQFCKMERALETEGVMVTQQGRYPYCTELYA